MTGKLMFVPDTHVVVPRADMERLESLASEEFSDAAAYIQEGADRMPDIPEWAHIVSTVSAAPQLTTPPVLRWEQDSEREDIWELLLYGVVIAVAHNNGWDAMYAGSSRIKKNPEQARRAAEKALGFPEGLIIPEV